MYCYSEVDPEGQSPKNTAASLYFERRIILITFLLILSGYYAVYLSLEINRFFSLAYDLVD